jgi:hypothetical protein
MEKTLLNQVTDVLKQRGNSDDQIAEFLADLSKEASERLYVEALAVLDDEDLKAIAATTIPQETNYEVLTRFAKKTGQNPNELMKGFLDEFSRKFLEECQKEKDQPIAPNPPPIINTTPSV